MQRTLPSPVPTYNSMFAHLTCMYLHVCLYSQGCASVFYGYCHYNYCYSIWTDNQYYFFYSKDFFNYDFNNKCCRFKPQESFIMHPRWLFSTISLNFNTPPSALYASLVASNLIGANVPEDFLRFFSLIGNPVFGWHASQ